MCAAQAPELYAFAIADEASYYLFVINEDEAAPAETTLDLELWNDVPGGSVVIACLVAEGYDHTSIAAWTLLQTPC